MTSTPLPKTAPALLHWTQGHELHSARWQSEAGQQPPKRVVLADDTLSAAAACHLAAQGTGLLWQGDFQNARQLLQAMARRLDKPPKRAAPAPANMLDAFNQHRMQRAQRARNLGALLIRFEAGHAIALRRAPNVQAACTQAQGEATEPYVASLRELLGVVGAHEWRKKGVDVPSLGARIHPHYAVYSPLRGEYLSLLAQEALPPVKLAVDVGTGSGVISALLLKRGVPQVLATDTDARAIACAHDNLQRLGIAARVQLLQTNLFAPGQADLIVCNPPWLPAKPSAPIEHAIYDPDSQMLRGYLSGLAAHLNANGQGWLILSDLAEHLGLRSREQLMGWIAQAGLQVLGKRDIRPQHPKTQDTTDMLHAARAAEVTSLWRLGKG